MAIVRPVLNGSVSLVSIQLKGYAEDALVDGGWDFKGDCSKVPITININILNGKLEGLVGHRALDHTPKTG